MRHVWSALFIVGISMVYGAFKFYFWFAKRMESKDPELNGSKHSLLGSVGDPELNRSNFTQQGIFIFLALFAGGILLAVFSLLSLLGVKITN